MPGLLWSPQQWFFSPQNLCSLNDLSDLNSLNDLNDLDSLNSSKKITDPDGLIILSTQMINTSPFL